MLFYLDLGRKKTCFNGFYTFIRVQLGRKKSVRENILCFNKCSVHFLRPIYRFARKADKGKFLRGERAFENKNLRFLFSKTRSPQ
jgi:hypothetical protein